MFSDMGIVSIKCGCGIFCADGSKFDVDVEDCEVGFKTPVVI